MGAFKFETTTNSKENSHYDVVSHWMPATFHFFIVVDEVGKDGVLVRKVYASPTDPHLLAKNLSDLQIKSEVWPEKYGMKPVAPNSPATVAEHVLSSRQNPSSYLSASSEFPDGSPRFQGKVVYIDIERAKAAGAKLVTTDEIVKALEDYKKVAPQKAAKITQISDWVKNIDKEVLIQSPKVPASSIFTPRSLKFTKAAVKGLKVVRVFAIGFTAYDLEQAAGKSIDQKSVKPISIEVVKQAGGWGGAVAGARVGAMLGAAVGIETGPGALVTGAIGGIIFGTAGYFSASWLTEHMH